MQISIVNKGILENTVRQKKTLRVKTIKYRLKDEEFLFGEGILHNRSNSIIPRIISIEKNKPKLHNRSYYLTNDTNNRK